MEDNLDVLQMVPRNSITRTKVEPGHLGDTGDQGKATTVVADVEEAEKEVATDLTIVIMRTVKTHVSPLANYLPPRIKLRVTIIRMITSIRENIKMVTKVATRAIKEDIKEVTKRIISSTPMITLNPIKVNGHTIIATENLINLISRIYPLI